MEEKFDGFVFLDGAMGTMLQQQLLPLGERPELLNLSHPTEIQRIHRSFVDVGSDIIYSNTFGANAHKLSGYDISVGEVIRAGVHNAKAAAMGTHVRVALDIGPIGEMMEPSGSLSFESAYQIFQEIVRAGDEAGADLIVIETMTDLYEVKAAILASKENSNLPIFVTMSFEQDGRTFTGVCPESFVLLAQNLGVDALGVNCSLGPKELYPVVKTLSEYSSLPLIVKANAGLPNPETGGYDLESGDFGQYMKALAALGVKYIGGCCGTTPSYIESLVEAVRDLEYRKKPVEQEAAVCTPTVYLPIEEVCVIGERINPTGKKRIQTALTLEDYSFILEEAVRQQDEGADILDVNIGHPGIDEPVIMPKMVKSIQSVVDIPLQLDSSNYDTLEAGLRVYNGIPVVNSVNGTRESMEAVLPLVKKYGASVIVLTLDDDGIPKTPEHRIEIALKIVDRAAQLGIGKERLFIDCLTLTVSAEQFAARKTLEAMRRLRDEHGLKLALGVSNISFGLPNRSLINNSFLMMALENGLNLPIVNTGSEEIMNTIRSFRLLSGYDRDAEDYIKYFSNRTAKANGQAVNHQDLTLQEAVIKGLKADVEQLTAAALEKMPEMELIETILIPTLDLVGSRYEEGLIFLPQLIKSATAAQVAFDIIKHRIASTGLVSITKGKILLATVKGDIHDIGKNIVKVILENYGYQIVDLGRDVSIDAVVEAAIQGKIRLVGLSALMTTTLVSMEETIQALRESGHDCKIMVGGAVLTPDYALEIGADFYAADARDSVAIAKQILG